APVFQTCHLIVQQSFESAMGEPQCWCHPHSIRYRRNHGWNRTCSQTQLDVERNCKLPELHHMYSSSAARTGAFSTARCPEDYYWYRCPTVSGQSIFSPCHFATQACGSSLLPSRSFFM